MILPHWLSRPGEDGGHMNKVKLVTVIVTVVFLAGCKSISQKERDDLAKPIDCSTSEQDIIALQSEKASAIKQAEAGSGLIMPTSAIIGILSGDYSNREKVASGQYNKDIDNKIAEIKAACGK